MGRGPTEQLLHRNVQRFPGGLVFKAHRLCVSLNSRLESNKEEKKKGPRLALLFEGVSDEPLRPPPARENEYFIETDREKEYFVETVKENEYLIETDRERERERERIISLLKPT